MKKILFITPQNPELVDAGDKIYTWDILKAIKYKGDVYVHVVAYMEDYEENQNYSMLEALVDKVTYVPFRRMTPLRMSLSIYPAMISHRKTEEMASVLKDILNKESFDSIVVNMFKMSSLIKVIGGYPGRKIHISHNVEFEVAKSIYKHAVSFKHKLAYSIDFYKTKYWERRFLSQFEVVTAICDCDAQKLGEIIKKNVPVIRPVVDVKPYDELHKHTNKLIICGTFKWLPKIINIQNVMRCENIGLLKKKGKYLQIIGKAHECVLTEGNTIDNVYVSGSVDSVEPFYKDAEVALIPEQSGGGFKLKIAEAVQHHIPIVAIKGSVTDFMMKPDVHYIEAEDFDELLIKGIRLIDNRDRQEELVKNAVRLFSNYYTIDAVHEQLHRVLF